MAHQNCYGNFGHILENHHMGPEGDDKVVLEDERGGNRLHNQLEYFRENLPHSS